MLVNFNYHNIINSCSSWGYIKQAQHFFREILINKTNKHIKCSHQTKQVICLFFNDILYSNILILHTYENIY